MSYCNVFDCVHILFSFLVFVQRPMVCARIGIPHILIYTLRHGQLFMPSALHDAPFFHDNNLVCGDDGRKAMGNHDDRLVLYQRLQSHLHLMLVFRVSESSRFVQHQYRRILQYGTSHTYPLGFTAGQEYTFIAYPCFVALRPLSPIRVS